MCPKLMTDMKILRRDDGFIYFIYRMKDIFLKKLRTNTAIFESFLELNNSPSQIIWCTTKAIACICLSAILRSSSNSFLSKTMKKYHVVNVYSGLIIKNSAMNWLKSSFIFKTILEDRTVKEYIKASISASEGNILSLPK